MIQALGLMDIFTARPERIIGNVALASLVAGIPVGIVLALLGALQSPDLSAIQWLAGLGSGALLGPVLIFIAGFMLIAPLLHGLRRFGYGGPLFVYAMAAIFSLTVMASDLRSGIVSLVLSIPAAWIFCRHAYVDANRHDL
jgi:hypothetical protein